MNSNQRVVTFALDTKWNDLPETVQHQSKRALLDNLGVLIAGGITPASKITRAFVEDQLAGNNSKAACTVVSTAKKVSAVGAALANGIAANGLDMDDGYKAAKGHPGAALLPVLLAATEHPRRNDSPFLLYHLPFHRKLGSHRRSSCGR
jgi:2-methylcitrate dehydratase PrpD